jgi:hypothetical protein
VSCDFARCRCISVHVDCGENLAAALSPFRLLRECVTPLRECYRRSFPRLSPPILQSLWNANSWHWENRNYNVWGAAALRERLLAVTAESGGVSLRVAALREAAFKCEASVCIRKGKKVPLFDISFTAEWEARGGAVGEAAVRGEAAVLELGPDDVDDFSVRVSVVAAAAAAGGAEGRPGDLRSALYPPPP